MFSFKAQCLSLMVTLFLPTPTLSCIFFSFFFLPSRWDKMFVLSFLSDFSDTLAFCT